MVFKSQHVTFSFDALVFGHLQFNLYMYICVQRFRPMTALFSKNQGAFALGRSIIDNIIIAHCYKLGTYVARK